jgi:single-stranded-DNA-specific exonuclease
MSHPKITARTVNQSAYQALVEHGLLEPIARVIAARPFNDTHGVINTIEPTLKLLDSPFLLKDMDVAVARLSQALDNNEVIALETDHDCDGQTSHAVLVLALTQVLGHPKDKVLSFIGHRMKEGYGLSAALADRIVQAKPDLVITADNGSSDETQIAVLKAAGIDVIVTDHHAIPTSGIPQSAVATLNPTREDCTFPDPDIAGCMVAWLFMAGARRSRIEQGKLPKEVPSVAAYLDFVAVGTVADCVSLARSVNNRAVVRAGLKMINQFKRPCWQALRPLLSGPKVRADDLGFLIGPMLNSDGRLSDAMGSVSFLLASENSVAMKWAQQLYQSNQDRKAIQKDLSAQAVIAARAQVQTDKHSIVVDLGRGHAGVHGISASRIKDEFGRPTILFSQKQGEPDILSGSARSIDNLHMRDALQTVHDAHPDLIIKFGGHRGAAGLSITQQNFEVFANAFEQVVIAQLGEDSVGPELFTDGPLDEAFATIDFVNALEQYAPFGREFDVPLFEADVVVNSVNVMGATKTHLRLSVQLGTQLISAVWFGALENEGDTLPVSEGDTAHLLFTPQLNYFNGRVSLQCMVRYCNVGE